MSSFNNNNVDIMKNGIYAEDETEQISLKTVFSKLSPRELQVIYLSSTGRTYREIASLLGTSHNTVKNQVANSLLKYEASTLSELIYKTILSSIPAFIEYGEDVKKYYYEK